MAAFLGPVGPIERKIRATERLEAALAPQTPAERSVVEWLVDWEVETVEALATMVERARTARR